MEGFFRETRVRQPRQPGFFFDEFGRLTLQTRHQGNRNRQLENPFIGQMDQFGHFPQPGSLNNPLGGRMNPLSQPGSHTNQPGFMGHSCQFFDEFGRQTRHQGDRNQQGRQPPQPGQPGFTGQFFDEFGIRTIQTRNRGNRNQQGSHHKYFS